MKLEFTGSFYNGDGYRFTEPGQYDVTDAKAKQLLSDFPDRFAAVEGTQKQQNDSSEGKSLSKMNKDELHAYAGEIGATVDEDMTNRQLQEAIKAHQEEA